jgi:uncharacterized OsmC-like protein
MTTKTKERIINGVNTTQLRENIEAVKNDAQLADFKFKASNKWNTGAHNQFTIDEFYGLKETLKHKKPFVHDCAEPEELLGEDNGTNPVEYVLGALSGCMTTTLAYYSALANKNIESISSEYEGDIDLQGFLGVRDDVNKGYNEIRVKFKVKGDATEEEIKEIVKNSPVYDTLKRPITIKIDVVKE